jgi:hypothetical protein
MRILLESSTESEWVATCLEDLRHEIVVADPNYAPVWHVHATDQDRSARRSGAGGGQSDRHVSRGLPGQSGAACGGGEGSSCGTQLVRMRTQPSMCCGRERVVTTNCVLFSSEKKKSLVLSQPPIVALASSAGRPERWEQSDFARVLSTMLSSGTTRTLRTRNVQRAHRHITIRAQDPVDGAGSYDAFVETTGCGGGLRR